MVSSPVYTTENECQDCYKCVRHCPVKAIRIVDGKASVIPEACVACGECVLACPGGCVNGPAMPRGASGLATLFATDATAPIRTSAGRCFTHCGTSAYPAAAVVDDEPDESAIAGALARVGKTTKADEINCGACGYNSCREFAKALLAGKAEEAMCHIYLKKSFQRTSNALIKYIPAGVVIVDAKEAIVECNRLFAEMAGAAA